MNPINEHIDVDAYPSLIWKDSSWLSLVFKDDCGDGLRPRHINENILNVLIHVVSELGEETVWFSDFNLDKHRSDLALEDLDDVQQVASSIYVYGSHGWAMCGTGDGWCAVGGCGSVMKPFIAKLGGFTNVKRSYPDIDMLPDHRIFLANNFKNA